MIKDVKKVVLAYSGGLDTSVILRWLQDTRFGRINETDLGKVAFAKMADSMGVPGARVQSVSEFEQHLKTAMATEGPYLIDIDMAHLDPMEISIMPKKTVELGMD